MTPMSEVSREFAERLHAVGCPVTFEPMCLAPQRLTALAWAYNYAVAEWAYCEFGLEVLDSLYRSAPHYASDIYKAWCRRNQETTPCP